MSVKTNVSRAELETLIPAQQMASTESWVRELLLQVLCARAELTGRDPRELAAEVLPGLREPLNETTPAAHVLRDLLGGRR